jgi:hypothetical protein
MNNIQLSNEVIERVFNEMIQRAAPKWKFVFDREYQDRTDKSTHELVGAFRPSFPPRMWKYDLLRFAETIASGVGISTRSE